MKDILVVFHGRVGCMYQVEQMKKATKATGEKIVIDEVAGTWHFSGEKLAWLGAFKFGMGPTNEQQKSRYIYPKTQTVFDRMNNKHLNEAFSFLSSSALASGYESGGAMDAD